MTVERNTCTLAEARGGVIRCCLNDDRVAVGTGSSGNEIFGGERGMEQLYGGAQETPVGNPGPIASGQVAADAHKGVKTIRAEEKEEDEGNSCRIHDSKANIMAEISPVLEDEVIEQPRNSGSETV